MPEASGKPTQPQSSVEQKEKALWGPGHLRALALNNAESQEKGSDKEKRGRE